MADSNSHLRVDQSTGKTIIVTSSKESTLSCSLTTEWLTSVEAAKYLRISVETLRNMTSNGKVPFYKLGRRNRYRKDELEVLLLSQKRGK